MKAPNKVRVLFCATIVLVAAILLTFMLFCDLRAEVELNDINEKKIFDSWISLIKTKKMNSDFAPNATTFKWRGFDGNLIRIGVNQPNVALAAKSVVFLNTLINEDSTYSFQESISKLRNKNANLLNVVKGEYHFFGLLDSKIKASKGLAHIYLENLHDIEINGNGATFVFHNNEAGIIVQQSQRLKIKNLTLKFMTNDKSIARVTHLSGEKILTPLLFNNRKDSKEIAQVIELNNDFSFKLGGKRLVYPPDASKPQYFEDGFYRHKTFNNFENGSKFLVLHHWYGGQAIKIDGDRGYNQTEDISIDNVKVLSTPGMAISVTGLKRGLLLENSVFGSVDGSLLDSPSWDALHIHQAGGDIIIRNNIFYGMTDDAINLYNPIHSIQSFDLAESKVTLKTSSRFIKPNDQLAFFNSGGRFEGAYKVIANKSVGNGIFEFRLNKLPTNIQSNWIVRDVSLFSGGFYIADNTFTNLSGHAILAQTVNGLIENNQIYDLTRNAIRLLSSVGVWREGVGAINLSVRKNTIQNPGLDFDHNIPWAAITLYSITEGSKLPDFLINDSVEISSNKIINPKQNCIAVTNTNNAKVIDNECFLDGTSIRKYVVRKSVNVTTQ